MSVPHGSGFLLNRETWLSKWFTPDVNPVRVKVRSTLVIKDGKSSGVMEYGKIVAQKKPNGESLLRLLPSEEYIAEFEYWWGILFTELVRQGWIDAQSGSVSEQTSKEEKPMPSNTPATTNATSSTYTCFISYSQADEAFAAKLYADLKSHGVKVWRFAEDAKWGATVWGEITEHIQENDKLIVICSVNSLTSGPVSREMERALGREDAEHKNVLFPIRIDDYIFARDAQGKEIWQHPRRADVLSKIVGDFRGWDTDATRYNKAFDKLLEGLQA